MIVKVKCLFPAGDLMFATQTLQDGNGNWVGKITAIGNISRSIGPDRTYETSSVSIEFDDTDRSFKDMMSGNDRFIAGKTVELYTDTDAILYRGTVESWEFGPASFTLNISDLNAGLSKTITVSITRSDFDACDDESEGQTIPLIYGHMSQAGGAVTAYRVERWKYIVAAHECYSIEGVFDPEGTEIGEDDYIDDVEEDGFHYITFVPAGDEPATLRVNVKGKKNQAGDLIDTPYGAAVDILTANAIDYDTDSLEYAAKIFTLRGYTISAAFTKETTVRDLFQTFCTSFDCDYYISKEMLFRIAIADPWNLKVEKTFQPAEVVIGRILPNPDGVIQKIRYMFAWSPVKKDFIRKPYFFQASAWPEVQTEPLALRLVGSDACAFDVVQRFALQRREPPPSIPVEINLVDFTDIDIGSFIEVSSPDLIPTQTRVLQIVRAEIDTEMDVVELECRDVVGLAGQLAILGDELQSQNWLEANGDEKKYSYLCDKETGTFSDGTPGKVLY